MQTRYRSSGVRDTPPNPRVFHGNLRRAQIIDTNLIVNLTGFDTERRQAVRARVWSLVQSIGGFRLYNVSEETNEQAGVGLPADSPPITTPSGTVEDM